MKVIGCVLFILLRSMSTSSYTSDALDYVLNTIEYLASVKPGVFSCILWDIKPHESYENMFGAILNSPRLDHVVKYTLNGTYYDELNKLPWHPSMLLIHPGHDISHLNRKDTYWHMNLMMKLFNPTTKVLVFVDGFNTIMIETLVTFVHSLGSTYSVYFDSFSMKVYQCNGFWGWTLPRVPHPMHLFTSKRHRMTKRNITFRAKRTDISYYWNVRWIEETARYLQTEAVESHHDCYGTGEQFRQCMAHFESDRADISLTGMMMLSEIQADFRQVFTTIPNIVRVAVPRDRPLNIAELMVMPFTLEVWVLLIAIMILAEAAKKLFPDYFINDPILLAVCDFERFNLHQSGRLEKIIFHSLIIFMFFMSNAFETKIVSLMVNKPSIQRIKTLDDLAESGLKYYVDLENNPHYINDSLVGKLVVQGKRQDILETRSDGVLLWNNDMVDLFKQMTFDDTRMEPFYVVLNYEHFSGHELYSTKRRSPFLEVFRRMHLTLVEAGLMSLWKQQAKDELRFFYINRRLQVGDDGKMDLNFDDVIPAWIILAIGLCISMAGFIGERITYQLKA